MMRLVNGTNPKHFIIITAMSANRKKNDRTKKRAMYISIDDEL